MFTRRELLKGAAASLGAAALAACQPKVVEVTRVVEKEVEKVVKETVIVEGTPQVVEKVVKEVVEVAPTGPTDVKVTVSGWVDTQWSVSQRANEYNASQDKVRVTIVPMPGEWETKAMSQIEKGAPSWDGHLTHHPFRVSVQWLAQGLIQTIDDYLETNSVVDMGDFWNDCIDPELMRFDCSVKGQVVGVPLGIDTCCQGFRTDYMAELGLPATREEFMEARSWANITEWGLKIREQFRDKQVFGIGNHNVYHQSLGQIYQSITKDLYYEDGLIKFDSEAMIEALRIQSNWSWSGAAPTPIWPSNFANGACGIWIGQVGVNGAAQRAWGKDRVPDAMPALVEDGGTGGSQWYTTCGFVLNKAAHPQELVDFYMWMFGPQNDTNAQACLQYNWFPCFKSQWEKQVDPNPANVWAKDFLPQFLNAELIPRNPYYEIEHSTVRKYSELAQAEKMDVKEAAEETMAEVRDLVSKLKIDW
jgi:ABC-type glycerol-3-phosphate transport system substrate-binding protein